MHTHKKTYLLPSATAIVQQTAMSVSCKGASMKSKEALHSIRVFIKISDPSISNRPSSFNSRININNNDNARGVGDLGKVKVNLHLHCPCPCVGMRNKGNTEHRTRTQTKTQGRCVYMDCHVAPLAMIQIRLVVIIKHGAMNIACFLPRPMFVCATRTQHAKPHNAAHFCEYPNCEIGRGRSPITESTVLNTNTEHANNKNKRSGGC
jgi:hypothetical protein